MLISFKEEAYKRVKDTMTVQKEDKLITLSDIIDTITDHILTNYQPLILDIERGKLKRDELNKVIEDYITSQDIILDNMSSYQAVVNTVYDYIFGYRFIQPYIDRLDVSDIAIKGLNDSWIKVSGKRQQIDLSFPSQASILTFARSIAVKCRSSVTKANALVVFGDNNSSKDFNLRINIGIEPVNTCPHIVIRKIPKYHIKPTMDNLRELGMFDSCVQQYIEQAYRYGLNVGIYGKGASGKTTLLNAAIESIPESCSKLCIQEINELSSGKKNWIWQTVVKKEAEADIEYDLYRLANNGLLLDIDYFIIGESKGAESMALFEALYTGHAVSFTAHAPSENKGNDRVVLNMKKSGTDYNTNDLLRMTAEMDVSIFMEDFKVKTISEIEGFDDINNRIIYRPIFKYNGHGYDRINDSCNKVKIKLSRR